MIWLRRAGIKIFTRQLPSTASTSAQLFTLLVRPRIDRRLNNGWNSFFFPGTYKRRRRKKKHQQPQSVCKQLGHRCCCCYWTRTTPPMSKMKEKFCHLPSFYWWNFPCLFELKLSLRFFSQAWVELSSFSYWSWLRAPSLQPKDRVFERLPPPLWIFLFI